MFASRSCGLAAVAVVSVLLLITSCDAWTTIPSPLITRVHNTVVVARSSTLLHTSTSPQKSEESSIFGTREEASNEAPPASFWELHPKSVRAVLAAMQDGHQLLEIEYPPLAASVMEQDDIGAYQVSRANFDLALDFARSLRTSGELYNQDLNIAILLPDDAEVRIALDSVKNNPSNVNLIVGDPQKPYPGITISSLRTNAEMENKEDDNRSFKPEQFFLSLFGGAAGGEVRAIPGVNVYVILTASAQELPDIETLHQLAPDATIICFNLKLDILRGDLGAPAFPPKDFQDRFLSRVKPVYYLRTRQYSRSVSRAPFIVSYQGCLFRSYPGDFQTLLDTGSGRYRRIASNPVRPALGAFKEELTQALREQGILEEEGSTLNFLRTGYKVTTWWEEDRENASDAWKT